MFWNRAQHVLRRIGSGLRRRPALYLISISTLAAAFLSFAATVTAASNLDNLLSRWIGSAEITVYLSGQANEASVSKLAAAVRGIDGVAAVETRSSAAARDELAVGLGEQGDMARTLPESAFPASLDISLSPAAARDQGLRHDLAERLRRLDMVSSVELYDDWFERLSAITLIGRLAAWGLGLVALAVAILVVAAVIRSGVVTRAKEIEVLRLVGATEGYVRLPFLIEGTLQGLASMAVALGLLHLLTGYVEGVAGDVLPLLGSGSLMRLSATACLGLLIGACVAGLVGARVSVQSLRSTE